MSRGRDDLLGTFWKVFSVLDKEKFGRASAGEGVGKTGKGDGGGKKRREM